MSKAEREATMMVAVLALGYAACGGDDTTLGTRPSTTSSASSSAGTGGDAGAGTTSSTGGAGGRGGSATGGGGEGGGIDPIDTACTGDHAFEAAGMAFVFPTPPELGQALGALAYDPTAHPITVVLRPELTIATASAADGGAFLAAHPWAIADISAGGFATVGPIDAATLRFLDPDGGAPIDIAVENVTLAATTFAGCSYATVLLDAAIPASQADVGIPIGKGKTKSLGELADGSAGGGGSGGQGGGSGGWLLRALFQAQSTSFDFAALDGEPHP